MSVIRLVCRLLSRGCLNRRAAGVSLVILAVAWWGVYLLSETWWIGDILLSGSAYVGVVLFLLSLLSLGVWRSWRMVFVWVCCSTVGAMTLHERRVFPVGVGSDQTYLKVLSMNLNFGNPRADEIYEMLLRLDDDVIVLVEPRWEVFEAIRAGSDSLNKYPFREYRLRESDITAGLMILSRWEMARDSELSTWAGVSVVVNRDESIGGPFRVVGLYAHSPRSGERWELGNRIVGGVVDQAGRLGLEDGIPLLIAGDLNGGPMSVRDRVLRRGLDVQRASSFFDYRGTYPSNLSMFGLLIDDIWMSDGFESISWATVDIPGSDHFGVRAELINSD